MIAIDSMVLVYAGWVPRKSTGKTKELEELKVRAQALLRMHQKKGKATIILPTIAISEILVPVPEAQKGVLAAKLSALFVCPAFDLPAAAIAASLWSQHKKLPSDLQYENRHVVRPDAMIVASAKSSGATDFYTHDRKCRALANLIMTGHDLPTHDPEHPLFPLPLD